MMQMLDNINSFFGGIFNVLFLPFKNVHPAWGMLVISFLTGIVMLFIFKATSDQAGIKRAKNLVKGHFLAIRLYRDDISLMFDTMSNILLSNFLYMKKSIRPMLFLLIPVAIIILQLGVRYEHRPLQVGETTVVSLQLAQSSGSVDLKDIELELPDGLSLEIPPVRITQLREINWRIKCEKPGKYNLLFKHDDKTLSKELHVVDSLQPVAADLAKDDVITVLMNPAESSLSDASFASAIHVLYPKREFDILGINMHWLLAFFIISLVAAFSFKGLLGVEV